MTQQSHSAISRRKFVAGVGGAGAIALAGCTQGENSGNSLSGSIKISGSSTVFPIAQAVSEVFKEDYSDVSFDISRDGSSAGFSNFFIPEESDLNNASRPITEGEKEQIADKDFEALEFELAQDALVVVVNNENDWLGDGLTYDQLEQIWNPDDPAQQWSDVVSNGPEEDIELFGPATTSGTLDYFTEEIMGEKGRIRSDFQGTEKDDTIASGVEGNQYAMGYLPFSYYTENSGKTQAVKISESGDSFVEPSLEGASSGEYPLSRPLFTYANSNKVENNEHLQAFLQFYIEKSGDKSLIADEIGYVQSPDEQVQSNLDTLKEYTGGSLPLTSTDS